MCVNYQPPTRAEFTALTYVSIDETATWPAETWQDYAAPIIRSGQRIGAEPELLVGSYGMIPKRYLSPGKKNLATMNARAETVGQKQAYAKAWRNGQTCLIPVQHFYEPNHATGRSERWAIGMADDAPFCVAGLWRAWEEAEGGYAFSFTQITINADEHPLMRRFHRPGDEKRSLVIVPRSAYQSWLACREPEIARTMLTLYPSELMKAWPAPKSSNERALQARLF